MGVVPPATRRQVWGGLVLLVLGLLVVLQSVRLSVGSLADPGPGLFPALTGLSLAALAAVIVLRPSPTRDEGADAPARSGRLVALTIALLAYPAFLEGAGYLVTMFGTMLLVARATGIRRWRRAALFAAVATAASYAMLDMLLGAHLPFGRWLR